MLIAKTKNKVTNNFSSHALCTVCLAPHVRQGLVSLVCVAWHCNNYCKVAGRGGEAELVKAEQFPFRMISFPPYLDASRNMLFGSDTNLIVVPEAGLISLSHHYLQTTAFRWL